MLPHCRRAGPLLEFARAVFQRKRFCQIFSPAGIEPRPGFHRSRASHHDGTSLPLGAQHPFVSSPSSRGIMTP